MKGFLSAINYINHRIQPHKKGNWLPEIAPMNYSYIYHNPPCFFPRKLERTGHIKMIKVGPGPVFGRNSRQTPSLWATQLSYKHLHIYHQFPSIWNHLKLWDLPMDLGLISPSFTIICHHFNGFFPSFPMIFVQKKGLFGAPGLADLGIGDASGGPSLVDDSWPPEMPMDSLDIWRDLNKKTEDLAI